MMANLVGDSGCNKGQLSYLVEAICRDFRRMCRFDASHKPIRRFASTLSTHQKKWEIE